MFNSGLKVYPYYYLAFFYWLFYSKHFISEQNKPVLVKKRYYTGTKKDGMNQTIITLVMELHCNEENHVLVSAVDKQWQFLLSLVHSSQPCKQTNLNLLFIGKVNVNWIAWLLLYSGGWIIPRMHIQVAISYNLCCCIL